MWSIATTEQVLKDSLFEQKHRKEKDCYMRKAPHKNSRRTNFWIREWTEKNESINRSSEQADEERYRPNGLEEIVIITIIGSDR